MKSVITQGTTVAKAIEEALKKADMPKEFFVKLLEDAQAGFLGFGSKKAKIALFFKEEAVHSKHQESMFEKGSYENLFNNPNMKKQIEQQLKDLGLEIKPIVTPVQSKKPTVVSQHEPVPTHVTNSTSSMSPTKMHTRPLPNRSTQPQQQQSMQPRRQPQQQQTQVRSMERNVEANGVEGQPQSDEYRRKRRPRYYRPRSRTQSSDQRDGSGTTSQNKSNSDGSDF